VYHSPDNIDWTLFAHSWDLTAECVAEQMAHSCVIYTPQEALNIMDLTTKPGWPWSHRYPTKQKYFESEDFVQFFPKFWHGCAIGEPPNVFDTLFLKREMREIAKCAAGMARAVFNADPNTVLLRVMYLKSLDQSIMASSNRIMEGLPFAPGMSPFYRTFDYLAQSYDGWVCFELDGKAWDAHMFDREQLAIAELRLKFLPVCSSIERNIVRSLYALNLMADVILPNGSVQSRFTGNPSGQGNTTMDNCFKTFSSNVYAFQKVVGRMLPLEGVFKYVKFMIFGDDNTWGVNAPLLLRDFKLEPAELMARVRTVLWDDYGHEYTCSLPSKFTDLKWLNLRFVQQHHLRRDFWMPTPDPVKMIASLALSPSHSHYMAVERALSIRMLSFANEPLFEYLSGYLKWLLANAPSSASRGIIPHTPGQLLELFLGIDTPIGSKLVVSNLEDDGIPSFIPVRCVGGSPIPTVGEKVFQP
jgi:hypothetical protein